MPVNNRIAAEAPKIAEWRRSLHRIPEILYDLPDTARFVAERLREIGCDEVVEGIGGTGVVGLIHGHDGGPVIGLRADMDALPIHETADLPYRSERANAMHACGHDGHMAMLLGGAEALASTRRFRGTVAVIFQPAEEGGAGAKAMIEDGLLERFAIARVFGMHNLPGLPLGHFAIRPGPIMASTDEFTLTLHGRGSHAAIPHQGYDPILAGASLVQALQQIASRNVDPLDSVVVSVTQFHAGFAHNVIPQEATVSGTVRSLTARTRDLAERRIREISAGIGAAHGVEIAVDYDRNYPVTLNHAAEAAFCAEVAAEVAGESAVNRDTVPLMGGEDFSYMLEQRPGAFIFVGNGASAGLHHPAYDFNDEAIPFGSSYWLTLVERALPLD
ncbi:M20 aminoacylase family protein [Aureimonas jatrophae]|uniref:Hippurate hydrolase n=1 Tax=Aureimonas jatrophae TaxID=1166073 RepID=A0A1H0IEN2_9HYPH|nr:M20 aminoacylase family protein [Aureimonas jatrophae]MBB3952126.1 hippurate hydrolase [Aureimonas jatrophae]SDO29852.1 hippurate hydrolase [Aureimonas jatrophae]